MSAFAPDTTAIVRAFIERMLGKPDADDEGDLCWVSLDGEFVHLGGEMGTVTKSGWSVNLYDGEVIVDWADITSEEELDRLYAIVGFCAVNGFIHVVYPRGQIKARSDA